MNVKLHNILLRMSKLATYTWIFCYSLSMALCNTSHAQRKELKEIEVEVNFKATSLIELIDDLELTSDFTFVYSKKELKKREVNIAKGRWNLYDLLHEVSSQAEVSIKRVNDIISISMEQDINKLPNVAEKIVSLLTISGTVQDPDGMPLPGATVREKGTTNGTVTDIEGKFSLSVDEGSILTITYVGFVSQELIVDKRTEYNISLDPDIAALNEVVVVGYGTKRRDDLITSISSIKPTEALKIPSSDLGEMLRGKAAGVFVTVDDAGPGSSSKIQIRGSRSLSAGNDPLIIADGVPIGSINDINPNDIESIDILKDATSQAIYGARAANGVILITTKRGKDGAVSIDYNGYYGIQTVRRNFDVYSAQEFIQLKREAFRTENNGIYRSDNEIFTSTELSVMESGEYIDWEEELFRIAPISSHNLSLSSSNEKTSIYASINYLNQEGVVPGTDFQRGTIRLNADQKLNDWLTFGVNTSWQLSSNNTPGTENTLLRSTTSSPLGIIYNDDGSLRLNPSGVQESFNPLLDIQTTSTLHEDRNDIMNVFIDITPFEGFKYRFNGSRRSWNRETTSFSSSESLVGIQRGGTGFGFIAFEEEVEWQLENIITYDFKLAEDHTFIFTGVQSVIQTKDNQFRNESSNFQNDLLGFNGLNSANVNTISVGGTNRNLVSFVGRLEYQYQDRYYATASIRRDGSTVFGPNNKWANFPAFAIGWNVSNESFFAGNAINTLKIRASYGSVGNQAIMPFQSQSFVVQSDYIFGDTVRVGYVPDAVLPNPNLKWETSTSLNLGLDFGIWTSRLTGNIDVYDIRTTDMLVEQELEATTGYTSRFTNIGEVQNKGIELNISGVLIDRSDFQVSLGFTASKNINKIISLYGIDEDMDGIEDDDIENRWFIGRPIDVLYRFKSAGIFQEGENISENTHQPDARPGDIKIIDRDPTDGILNASTDRFIIPLTPDWYGSVNLNIDYKGLDFSASVYTVQGIVKDNPYLYDFSSGGSLRAIFSGIRQNYWTPENPTGNWPRPNAGIDPNNLFALGTQDASYIRLQNVTIGYSFPDRIISKFGITRLRLYGTGQNLFTWTDYQSYSPEKTPDQYPEAIMITGGIQLGF